MKIDDSGLSMLRLGLEDISTKNAEIHVLPNTYTDRAAADRFSNTGMVYGDAKGLQDTYRNRSGYHQTDQATLFLEDVGGECTDKFH